MTAPPANVAVVVVCYEARDDVLRCLASVRAHAGVAVELRVVDNASADGTAEAVRAGFPEARLLANAENVGFARANNLGWRESRAPFVLLLNPDAELRPGALPALLARLDQSPDVGAVGPRTLNDDGSVQVSFGPDLSLAAEARQRRLVDGVRRRRPDALGEAERLASREHEPDWLSASCLLVRRAALEAVQGFDEGFFLYEEDADLCLRLRRAGWRVVFVPGAEVVHRLGRSMAGAGARARLEYQRSHLRYYHKHNGPLQTGLLRAWLAAGAVGQAARALLAGDAAARREAAALLRVALGPTNPPRS